MNRAPRTPRSAAAAFAAAIFAAIVTAAPVPAQQQRTTAPPARRAANAPAQRTTQAPATQEPVGGLNTLSDDALYAELSARGQDSLLDRAFDMNRVPEAQRA